MIHPNSREALQAITKDGRRGNRCEQIMAVLPLIEPASGRRIAEYMGLDHAVKVNARLFELKRDGLIEICGEELDSLTGVHVSLYRTVKARKQRSLWA